MTGDFSRWQFDRFDNFSGVLAQQGRILSDFDGTAQTRIANHWQDTAARDTIGSDTAAVPADEPDSFHIDRAKVTAGNVVLTVQPGHIWADGILAYLGAAGPVTRNATYLQPPIQSPAADPTSIGAGVRDAVILEVWRESISAFQVPRKLLEPALGGPDTGERVLTAYDFRLFRMAAGDNCDSILASLQDDFSKKGKLTVSLLPPSGAPVDCPLTTGGGYTGFEHNLYRIEIANTNDGSARFKWSRFNGGLVGRGKFDALNNRCNITANLQALTSSNLTKYYLEAEAFDADLGRWKVVYGAGATLNGAGFDLTSATFGAIPGGQELFIRLWDDVRGTSEFPIQANPVELVDSIYLQFDIAAAANYTPGDYWTFTVRAGGIANDQVLIDSKPPEGIHYHRVPLAELDWNATKDVSAAAGAIEDCRVTFQPLTRISTCCTFRVGDGLTSHGDYKKIQDAINHLPVAGGEICVLPGTYTENVTIDGKTNVRIHGCGGRSIVVSAAPSGGSSALPVITITNSTHIELDSLHITADSTGIGILIDGKRSSAPLFGPGTSPPGGVSTTRHVTLSKLQVTAATRPAIETHDGQFLTIRECHIEMQDTRSIWPAVFFLGEDSLIERNQILVRSGRQVGPFEDVVAPASSATGGLQLAGTCARVRVIDNLIQGGIANGITLGSVVRVDTAGNILTGIIGWIVDADDPCTPCKPGGVIWIDVTGGGGVTTRSAGPLYDISIERNRIQYMGLNGIGVIAFFDPKASGETILVEGLSILGNRIQRCLLRRLAEIPTNMVDFSGFGGISLADVTGLTIHDNRIEDNGLNYLDPICGIFVLHGEGVDITRNLVRNNGAPASEPASRAKTGRRGGINIVHAVAPMELAVHGNALFPHQNGMPALKVHENVVSAPLGRALTVTATGPVSAVANHFASLGIEPQAAGFAVGAVLIGNLGVPIELIGELVTFTAIKEGEIGQTDLNAPNNTGEVINVVTGGRAANVSSNFMPDGSVLFANNHCLLDLLDNAGDTFITSISILTLDDLGFHNNQCMANLLEGWIFMQAYLFGLSCRVEGNRFEEPIFNAVFSAITLGIMNNTSGNQSTHCLMVYGWPNGVVKAPNTVFVNVLSKGTCRSESDFVANYGARSVKNG